MRLDVVTALMLSGFMFGYGASPLFLGYSFWPDTAFVWGVALVAAGLAVLAERRGRDMEVEQDA